MHQLRFDQSTKASREILEKKNSIMKELLTKKEVKDIIKNLKVSKEEFEYYLGYFLSYYEDRKCCDCCKNLDSCSKEIKGTVLKMIRKEDGSIEREYTLCPQREEQRKLKNNYLIRDFNDDLLKIDLDNMENKRGRFDYEKKILEVVSDDVENGMFIYGPSSSGKSYPLVALCNEFVKDNKTCSFADVKTFVESLKNSFGDNKETIRLMELVKTCDILVLDNLGEEKQTEWVRDDVISSIIDYRSKNNLITFITSCYTLEELEKMYNVAKTNIETGKLKARKFIDKIKAICPTIVYIDK